MADVFLSYVRADRNVASEIAQGLDDAGLSVWWDRYIQAGVDFSEEIERELAAARAVVVLWSGASVQSKWVRDEAAYARDRNRLVPIRLDAVEPPLGFRQVQSLDFQGRNKDVGSETFGMLVESLERLVKGDKAGNRPTVGPVAKSPRRTVDRRWIVWFGAAIIAATAAVALWSSISSIGNSGDALSSGRTSIGKFELMTDDHETARFGKGLTDTIRRVFTTIGLEAIGAMDTNQTKDPIGTEFVLRGNIDRADGKVVVSSEIVHARDGIVLWSTRRERDVADSEWLQERVALESAGVVSSALRVRRFADGFG